MSCIYKDFTGLCTVREKGTPGTDNFGSCIVEDDPAPSESCDDYESDNICDGCKADLNKTDCECE